MSADLIALKIDDVGRWTDIEAYLKQVYGFKHGSRMAVAQGKAT